MKKEMKDIPHPKDGEESQKENIGWSNSLIQKVQGIYDR